MQAPRDVRDVSYLWIHHQRLRNKTTLSWACILCPDRHVFETTDKLWKHASADHVDQLPLDEEVLRVFRNDYETNSAQRKSSSSQQRPEKKPDIDDPPPDQTSTEGPRKRSLSPTPLLPMRSLSGLGVQKLNIGGDQAPSDAAELDVVEGSRKRAAIGDGISAGSASPYRKSSASPPPRRSKARPTSALYGSESTVRASDMFDSPWPQTHNKQLWREQDAPTPRPAFVDPKNVASIHAQKTRAQALQPKSRKHFQLPQASTSLTPATSRNHAVNPPVQASQTSKDDTYDIILQPETRPISQEQLVAEVKGIYAGLVMVEAKCIEVDNKQATLAQTDTSAQPKLNNEQWQASIALHRTLLHEYHDFFLASQHPSASPALRRLASKYAMPASMWRHGVHSFPELLRHRLPASLDHMLAFIYLAYSMMALLYETVPAFEDTWIECLGDIGRYRMAIEDDDIKDREVWTGIARHWYSKASAKARTNGRLCHHLAILARPNALQQLFYYSKSFCVSIPFTSTRKSILTLFEQVLNTDNRKTTFTPDRLDPSRNKIRLKPPAPLSVDAEPSETPISLKTHSLNTKDKIRAATEMLILRPPHIRYPLKAPQSLYPKLPPP